MNYKFVTGHGAAISSLYVDVGRNAVRCYDVDNFPVSTLSAFYPSGYLGKCTSVTVAISGDNSNQRDWMIICPYRIDETGRAGDKVYDIDPYVVTLDADTGTPIETGILAYHQGFEGRTMSVSGYNHLSKAATVSALRQEVATSISPLSAAPATVLNALGHMAKVFRKELSGHATKDPIPDQEKKA